ncbi:aminotransferase class IV [Sulfuriroseicoccus oceanibius]|uniref:branched-chain-amino-acid transaminase n=1 Tax=Sulfuriroseicoccus oceanibius TaxID=2707525 RepID=A0A6B3L1N7_9BACT|nr:aminotransferase class IV [Sulfuriroseicoccus oceanibius]QQL44357.1 aminotransferase class IV [Sulfuriroseicoccus oceanibius]
MADFVIVDGEAVPRSAPAIAASAPGLTTGMGVFTTMLAVDGRLHHAVRHYERLASNAVALGLDVPPASTLTRWCRLVLERNGLVTGRARVRISVYESASVPVVTVAAESTPEPAAAAKVALMGHVLNESSALAGVKCTSYAQNLLALREARAEGFDETLFFNHRGELAEGATSNVFVVGSDGAVATPELASGCLPGVMREVVIDRLRDAGLACDERVITREDVLSAPAVFLTSSLRGVQPVSVLGERALDPALVEPVVQAVAAWRCDAK